MRYAFGYDSDFLKNSFEKKKHKELVKCSIMSFYYFNSFFILSGKLSITNL